MVSVEELVPMTVEELIFKLQMMPQNAIVYTDGCSCRGRAGNLELTVDAEGRQAVVIKRPS